MDSQTDYCKNCHQHLLLHQKYCHNCGQKCDTHRINFHFLIHELQHGIFHVDGGIIYTLKSLFTKPGQSIRNYLEGKRQPHFKPVMLVVFLGGLCGLTQHFLDKPVKNGNEKWVDVNIEKAKESSEELRNVDIKGFIHYLEGIFDWFNNHLAFTILFFIPIAALGFYFGFRKYKFNYAEWLVYMCFGAGQALMAYFVLLLLSGVISSSILDWTTWVMLLLMLWTILDFFQYKNWRWVIFRTFWSMFLYGFFGVFIIGIFAAVVFYIGYLKFVN